MESFAKLMCVIGASQCEVDFVNSLPVELAELILRQLDPRSLLNVARVSRKWMAVCKGDSRLRRAVRHRLRKEKLRMTQNSGSHSKQSKTKEHQVSSTIVRMQADFVQRLSRQDYALATPVILVFRSTVANTRPGAPIKLSSKKNPESRASRIPTRSSAKLR